MYFLFSLILLASSHGTFAQNRVAIYLDSLQKSYPTEKLYLLFNKTKYLAGETIWFSAFAFSGYEPSTISTNLFVELYDGEKKLLTRRQLPLVSGHAAGQIDLSEKLGENIYFIRAYTRWMLNFPESLQYMHPVEILNPRSPKKLQLQNSPWNAEAIPEGGTLVDEVPSKVAVRLFSSSPLPKKWSGYLTATGSTEKITEFSSLDQNVAEFTFLPYAGTQYEIVIKDETGQQQVIRLPEVRSSGVHLTVQNYYDSVKYTIQFKNISGSEYKLIGTMNGRVIYQAVLKKFDGGVVRFIPTKNLDNGILDLTLFDANEHVAAERLCFVNPLSLYLKSPFFTEKKIDPEPRGQSFLQFQSDTIENPYSILVLDTAAESPMEDESFLSALWLTNDVEKPVESPAQYFEKPNTESADALDALLTTETLKDFSWSDVIKGGYPAIKYLPDKYISYKATVVHNKKRVTNEAVNLVFSFPEGRKHFAQASTDSAGDLVLPNLFFYDSLKVYYQLNQKKNYKENIALRFESMDVQVPYYAPLPATAYILVNRTAEDQKNETQPRSLSSLNNQKVLDNKYQTLREVKVRATTKSAKSKLNDELSSPFFSSSDETIFDFVNEDQHAQGYTNILEWLQGRVSGLRIQYQANGDLIPILRLHEMGVYIDEWPASPTRVSAISVSDIAMVKVLNGFFAGGIDGGGSGAIAIYTRRGNMPTANIQSWLNSSILTGYEKIRTYPAFDYSDDFYKQIKHDMRDVLFWNPFSVSENEQRRVSIKFYNNDSAKEFRIIIIGFTTDGVPVYYNSTMK